MSAVHVYLGEEAVHVLTDGAAYDGDGVLIALVSKTVPLPHLNAALTCIGPAWMGIHLAARSLDSFATFDELSAGFISKLRESVQADRQLFAQSPSGDRFSVYLTGVSESSGPCAFVVHSEASAAFRAWTLEPLPHGIISPFSPAFIEAVSTRTDLQFDADEFDPAIHGLAILREQRRHPGVILGTDALRHVIGGHASLTTITRDAMTTRILERWPDHIGEKISPELDVLPTLTLRRAVLNA